MILYHLLFCFSPSFTFIFNLLHLTISLLFFTYLSLFLGSIFNLLFLFSLFPCITLSLYFFFVFFPSAHFLQSRFRSSNFSVILFLLLSPFFVFIFLLFFTNLFFTHLIFIQLFVLLFIIFPPFL